MSDTTYHLVISRSGQPGYDIPLGTETLRSLALTVVDDVANVEVIEALAEHPAALVRAVVA